MISKSTISFIVAILLLLGGICIGFIEKIKIPLNILHLGIATSYVLLTPFVIVTHAKRFYTKGYNDVIAWLHFIIFAFLLCIAIKMYKRWLPKNHLHSNHEHFTNNYIVTLNNKKYNIEPFLKMHPGGSIIMNAFNEKNKTKDLKQIWKDENVLSIHMNKQEVKPHIMEKLEQMSV